MALPGDVDTERSRRTGARSSLPWYGAIGWYQAVPVARNTPRVGAGTRGKGRRQG